MSASAGCDSQNIKHLWKFNPGCELDTASFRDVTTTVRPATDPAAVFRPFWL